MPYSFTQIEKDKSKTIAFVFSFLILFYFVSIWLIILISKNFVHFSQHSTKVYGRAHDFLWLDGQTTLLIFLSSIAVALCHWMYTTDNLINKILNVLLAEPLNENDRYHKMYRNILDEVSVATGGVKIEGVVVPTMAMNAFALADFEGRSVIGITEGVLARLSRSQIEAIVGHEAAHVVSGDCLATTISSSLFELYSGLLRGIERAMNSTTRYSSRGGGGIALLFIVYILLRISRSISYLIRMFISRQREYRADAIATRLTRNPLSLAEALYAISYHWRGQSLAAEELEAIFIINPKYSALDEANGFVSDLFSTHPPTEERIRILLNMAHTDVESMIGNVKRLDHKQKVKAPEPKTTTTKQWMVNNAGQWLGPFDLLKIATLDWISPDTWIKPMDEKEIKMAYEDKNIASIANKVEHNTAQDSCPKCNILLTPRDYEGVTVEQCSFCHGVLIENRDAMRIIIREEYDFSDRIKKIAEGLLKEHQLWREQKINRDPKTLLQCPKCRKSHARMMRMFYTAAYPVEIDKCFSCSRLWFDRDELEILQYMIEKASRPAKS